MRTQSVDTPPEVETIQVQLFPEPGPRARLATVAGLKDALDGFALAGTRMRHGELPVHRAQSSLAVPTTVDPPKRNHLRGVR